MKYIEITFHRPSEPDWDYPSIVWPANIRVPTVGEIVELPSGEDYLIKHVNWFFVDQDSVSVELVVI